MPRYDLPADLERVYGRLGFGERAMYANFVSSVDGVVSLGSTPSAGSVISGRYGADRFLMGLLRACADAVVVGAATLRATPGHHWTPAHVYPKLASSFAELRERLGRRAEPRLFVLTASGEIDPSHPAIVAGATVVTNATGAKKAGPLLPASCDMIELGTGHELDLVHTIGELRSRGYEVLLTEGGPHVMGELVKRGLVDEVFLTVSPVVAGRDKEVRMGITAGVELLPARGAWGRLLTVRRHGDYLFLRYGLPAA